MKTKNKTTHEENDARLARIEGQVRGIRRMVAEGEYCIDIITQIEAARAALHAVSAKILNKHLNSCVADSFGGTSKNDAKKKAEEIMQVFRKCSR